MSDVHGTSQTPAEAPGGSVADEGVGPTGPEGQEEQVMDLLAEHVPLALLVDLLTPEGPASADILRTEGMPDDAWWERGEGDGSAAPDASASGAGAEPAGAQP